MATQEGILLALFKTDKTYRIGSDKHYCMRYLAEPFVEGPDRNGLANMKLSDMKKVFHKQHGGESVSLLRMLLLDCGDKTTSDKLKEYDISSEISFAGNTVSEKNRESYNFRRLLVHIATKLDESQLNDMVSYLQEVVDPESVPQSKLQNLLLLFERACQQSLIEPQRVDTLKKWLEQFERYDLSGQVKQFEPKKQFPCASVPDSASEIQRQCSDTGAAGQILATSPPSLPESLMVSLSTNRQQSDDSAFEEGDSRERSESATGPQSSSLASYSSDLSRARSGSVEETGRGKADAMVSGMSTQKK